jgi:serine/threonine protein kinase
MENALPPISVIESNSRPSVLAPGVILQERYRIVRQLGKGGMGAVYEAVDERLDMTVALKETLSVGERLRRQFAQEARLLAQLDHPALPRVTDYFTDGDRAFLVMQFISGVDVAEIIARQPGPLPRHQVIAWADQVLDALIYLHTRDRQIIHRDIKPHNLKLTSTGQIALLDFGLAKAEAEDVSGSTSSVSIFGYTRRYSPLEQIQDEGTTPQSDIYALGATLYHLLTGVKPPDAVARATALVNSKPDPLRPANEIHLAVGSEVAAILCRAMAQNAEDRYRSANDFREALWQVGRNETRAAARHSAQLSHAPTSNIAVVRKTRVSPVDPFDSYSILKPDEGAQFVPNERRGPNVIVSILVILLAAGFIGFYGYSHWIDPTDSVLNYAKATSDKDESGATVVSQSKSDNSRSNTSGVKNLPTASAVESSRRNDVQGHRTHRIDSASPNAPTVAPSPSSTRPPVQTGSGSSRSRTVSPNR